MNVPQFSDFEKCSSGSRIPGSQFLRVWTDALVNEKLHILNDPKIFEIDYRKAGTVNKAIQSRLAPVVNGKKDARITLNNKRGGVKLQGLHQLQPQGYRWSY